MTARAKPEEVLTQFQKRLKLTNLSHGESRWRDPGAGVLRLRYDHSVGSGTDATSSPPQTPPLGSRFCDILVFVHLLTYLAETDVRVVSQHPPLLQRVEGIVERHYLEEQRMLRELPPLFSAVNVVDESGGESERKLAAWKAISTKWFRLYTKFEGSPFVMAFFAETTSAIISSHRNANPPTEVPNALALPSNPSQYTRVWVVDPTVLQTSGPSGNASTANQGDVDSPISEKPKLPSPTRPATIDSILNKPSDLPGHTLPSTLPAVNYESYANPTRACSEACRQTTAHIPWTVSYTVEELLSDIEQESETLQFSWNASALGTAIVETASVRVRFRLGSDLSPNIMAKLKAALGGGERVISASGLKCAECNGMVKPVLCDQTMIQWKAPDYVAGRYMQ